MFVINIENSKKKKKKKKINFLKKIQSFYCL